MSEHVRVVPHGDVVVIQIDNPPVNALSPGVPEGIVAAVEDAEADAAIVAIVIMGAGRTFVAGADITTLEAAAWNNVADAANLHDLLRRIEDCTKPVVMAIHGTALGGGLELAMAGHYRVAVPDALVGQPEVNLGIIPGAEGTQRLPRLAGVEKALDMVVTGRPLKAPDAANAGVLDAVLDGSLETAAVAFAREVAARRPLPRTRDRGDRLGDAATNAPLYAAARTLATKVRRHQIAPLKAVDAVEAAATLPFEEGCRRERELFFECIQSEQAKAMIHVFFAERAAAKMTKIPNGGAETLPYTASIARVAIIGAGTMGAGIAMACANASLDVRLKDSTPAALDTGMANIRRNYETSVARGRFTPDGVATRLARIHPQLDDEGLGETDLVIEAVFENMDLKRQIFRGLDTVAKPGAILATNTSTLDIDAIAAETSRPDAVVGLHFFSPANVMRLVEIVRGRHTHGDVLAAALAFAKKLGKVGVVVGNCRGFVGNRIMFPYMYETQFMVEEGATPEQVDHALTGFGMAMGTFAVDDMAGLDVAWRVRQELGHFREPGGRKPLVQDRLYKMGRLGQKTGKGWYRYDEARKATPDPEIVDLIRQTAQDAGVPQRTFTDQEIVERAIYALVNEGARVLEEGYASRASDIDVIYVNGYGFPAWRGGPMFFADRAGLGAILERIETFHREFGDRWAPAPLLVSLVRDGLTFRERDRRAAS